MTTSDQLPHHPMTMNHRSRFSFALWFLGVWCLHFLLWAVFIWSSDSFWWRSWKRSVRRGKLLARNHCWHQCSRANQRRGWRLLKVRYCCMGVKMVFYVLTMLSSFTVPVEVVDGELPPVIRANKTCTVLINLQGKTDASFFDGRCIMVDDIWSGSEEKGIEVCRNFVHFIQSSIPRRITFVSCNGDFWPHSLRILRSPRPESSSWAVKTCSWQVSTSD